MIVEVHNRNDEGYKSDLTLDKENTLCVAISLESIKKDEVVKQGNTETGVTQSSRSSVISVADLFAKINPIDERFLKYVPKQFLTQAISSAKTSIKQIPALFKHKNAHFKETKLFPFVPLPGPFRHFFAE